MYRELIIRFLFISSSNTPIKVDSKINFTITHPFHPLYNQQFTLFDYRINWGEYRVFYFDKDGELKSIPAQWTSVYQPDPFLVISNGRSYFRVRDLLELAELIKKIEEAKEEKNEND